MQDKISLALQGLKDFQQCTVDYVFDRLYRYGQNKMLIADEVGLGKTIIAKGIIAKALQQFIEGSSKKKQLRVVYICSNQALSSQNIKKLNFTGDEAVIESEMNRLTYLAKNSSNKNEGILKISLLTPGTSFDNKNKFGEAGERAILFALLSHYAPFFNRWNGLKWLLKGNKGADWDRIIKEAHNNATETLRRDIFSLFREKLNNYLLTREKEPKLFEYFGRQESISMWHGLMRICDDVNGKNIHKFEHAGELVSTLRRLLAQVCVRYLDADLFILDEFQRYSQLIKWEQEEQSPAVEMAKAVFSLEKAKILMLSATPFKAYTNEFDELNGEVHYSEFRSVIEFLLQGKSKAFWQSFENNRKAFSRLLSDSAHWELNHEQLKKTKGELEAIYRDAMVRTERLLAANDGNALIEDILKDQTLPISLGDIEDFVRLDALCQRMNEGSKNKIPVPVEYAKSTPFALSFLDGYNLKKRLSNAIKLDSELTQMINTNKELFITRNDVQNYRSIFGKKTIEISNAKVRNLLQIDGDGWKLLWIPPTISYYPSQGVYRQAKHFSKTLVFSSWVMVPKMIATILSYEAERKSIGSLLANNKIEKDERVNYFEKPRSPRQQLTFRTNKGEEPRQLSNFCLIYPCITLANLYHPEKNTIDNLSLGELKQSLNKKIRSLLDKLNIQQFATGSGEVDPWFWAAPILIDRLTASSNPIVSDWFANASEYDGIAIDTEANNDDTSEHTGKEIHLEFIKKFFIRERPSLPPLPKEKYDELITHLVEITLASPATCFYRVYKKHFGETGLIVQASYTTALSILSLFNKPESIAIIRLHLDKKPYWQQVLEYCRDGNFQAMVDEFVYLLYDCENLKQLNTLQTYITDILTLKTASIDIDSRKSFEEGKGKMSIRTHYAMDFGLQKVVTIQGSNRQVNLRQTFNSPFRPFVLATTSIGQEGLDFHLYCKRIVHWNLPSNPIDFEQREGRINRYKSLVIRQNIADAYLKDIELTQELLWDRLFELAKQDKHNAKYACDLIPFWHVEPANGSASKIERFVPLYPFSKDIEKYKHIQQVLTYYRLTFGQPRQDDLIQTFKKKLDKNLLNEWLINLCPLTFDSTGGEQ